METGGWERIPPEESAQASSEMKKALTQAEGVNRKLGVGSLGKGPAGKK